MANYSTSQFKNGLKLMLDGNPCSIISNEQYLINDDAMDDVRGYLVEQDMCVVTLWNDNPISVTPPNHVMLEVVDTDPGLKGDTAGTGGKPATMNTGVVVQVPLFISIGERVKVDTRTNEYAGRS